MIAYQNTKLFKSLFWLAVAGVYVLAVLIPSHSAPSISMYDKYNHMIAFAVLGLLIKMAYEIGYPKSFSLLIGYGIWIEVSQYMTPTRSAEVADVVADIVGIAIGLTAHKLLTKIMPS